MPRKNEPQGRQRTGTRADAEGQAGEEAVDLLEVGPEDGDDLLEFEEDAGLQARIKVVGVGGAGGNALDTMIRLGLGGVEFIATNTDAQALEHKLAPTKVQLGVEVTRGLGCGANPEKGRASALEDRDKLRDLLIGSDMVFVTAGLGGGTGTGAAPVIAEVAREIGALTVAVVTQPFPFEGRQRMRHADAGLGELHRVVDTLITIPNQRLLALAGKDTKITESFKLADDVLLNAVKGISDLITVHGLINLDFADVRTIMNEMGMALMGTGVGTGENRAKDAAHAAISSPLLEDLSIEGARGVLINITGAPDMTLYEVNEASTLVQEAAHEDANIIFGAVIDESTPAGELRVTVIATGLDDRDDRPGRDVRAERDRFEPLAGRPGERLGAREREAWGTAAPQARAGRDARDTGLVLERREPVDAEPEALEPLETDDPEGAPRGDDGFVSPFEDELDVPAFLRRQRAEAEAPEAEQEDDDRELPAFLRRRAR